MLNSVLFNARWNGNDSQSRGTGDFQQGGIIKLGDDAGADVLIDEPGI